jgi:hypothetical protein
MMSCTSHSYGGGIKNIEKPQMKLKLFVEKFSNLDFKGSIAVDAWTRRFKYDENTSVKAAARQSKRSRRFLIHFFLSKLVRKKINK